MSQQMTFHIEQDILYIDLNGRIDVNNASSVEAEIQAVRRENQGTSTVLDADGLSYISSAGLRIILRLRKEDADLTIINVSPEVYGILEMTGFT